MTRTVTRDLYITLVVAALLTMWLAIEGRWFG